jgi:hypothetical protein
VSQETPKPPEGLPAEIWCRVEDGEFTGTVTDPRLAAKLASTTEQFVRYVLPAPEELASGEGAHPTCQSEDQAGWPSCKRTATVQTKAR